MYIDFELRSNCHRHFHISSKLGHNIRRKSLLARCMLDNGGGFRKVLWIKFGGISTSQLEKAIVLGCGPGIPILALIKRFSLCTLKCN